MTAQEKASKQVEVAGWLKSQGYDRRTWQGMAKIIVDFLAEHPVKSVGSGDVVGRREQLVAFLKWVGDGYDFENNAEKIVQEYMEAEQN